MIETIKGWMTYLVSVMVGAVGFVEKCNALLNLVFVALGIVGLILSIRLSLKKLKKFE